MILNPCLKNTKKIIIRSLNRKQDILPLESYIGREIIPRGLRERVVPAAHLQTEKFLTKWKKQCIDHGLDIMKLIVEEEKDPLVLLQTQILESSGILEPLEENPDFNKFNNIMKKEFDKTQKYLKIAKQNKFKRDLDDWAKGEIFDLTTRGGGNRSRNHRFSSCSGADTRAQSSGNEDEIHHTVSFLDKDLLELKDPPPSRGILKGGKPGTTGGGRSRGKGRQQPQGDSV